MIKDYFIENIESAIEKAIKENKLGEMKEYTKGSLAVERPKNADFGDYAVNVSSLARYARMAPPQIANSIIEYIAKEDNDYTVVGGFINFKTGKNLLINLVEEIFQKGSEFRKTRKHYKRKNSFRIYFSKSYRTIPYRTWTLGCNGKCSG